MTRSTRSSGRSVRRVGDQRAAHVDDGGRDNDDVRVGGCGRDDDDGRGSVGA